MPQKNLEFQDGSPPWISLTCSSGMRSAQGAADTFLGSFDGRFSLTNIDFQRKTAIVTFTVTNKTGWNSAVKVLDDKAGAVYVEHIKWRETISFK